MSRIQQNQKHRQETQNYSFTHTEQGPTHQQTFIDSSFGNWIKSNGDNPLRTMIDLSATIKLKGRKEQVSIVISLATNRMQQNEQDASVKSTPKTNSLQTTGLDLGFSNRTSEKKIGIGNLQKFPNATKLEFQLSQSRDISQSQLGGDTVQKSQQKNSSRNSAMHRFSMTLNNMSLIAKQDKQRVSQIRKKSSQNEMPDFGKDAPKISLKGRIESPIKNINPGPGEYEPRDSLSKNRIKAAYIKNGQRFIDNKVNQESPGPGNYYQDTYFARNVSPISIKGKAKETKRDENPGPGAYDPTIIAVRDAIRNINIASSQRPADLSSRKLIDQSEVPGPGTYEYKNKQMAVGLQLITLKGKIPEKIQNQVPGPGTYEVNSRSISPTIKITNGGQRFKTLKTSTDLGPGQYHPTQKLLGTEGPKFSLGGITNKKRMDESPGPGNYDANIDFARCRSPSITIKGRIDDRTDVYMRDLPGPGAYQPLKAIGSNAPKISMHGRVPSKIPKEDRLGPGLYEVKLDLIKSRVKTPNLSSSQKCVELPQSISPGPGAYHQQSPFGKNAPSFTLKPKLEKTPQAQSRSQSPAPGAYDPKLDFVNSSVKTFKFHGTPIAIDNLRRITSLQQALNASGPGPGEYEIKSKFKGDQGPKISIKGRIKDKNILSEVPGPGEYDPLRSLSALRDKSKGARISRSGRDNISVSQVDLPGPGQYNPTLPKSSISFSLTGKLQMNHDNDLPGPGTYNLPTPSIQRYKNPSYDFSKSPDGRKLPRPSIDLGPGQYNIHDINDQALLSGHSQIVYSFGKPSTGRNIIPNSTTPGPGAYDLPKSFGVIKQERHDRSKSIKK